MGKKFDLSDFEHSVVEWCDGHTTISISYRECLWNIHERMFFLLSLDIPINVWGKKKYCPCMFSWPADIWENHSHHSCISHGQQEQCLSPLVYLFSILKTNTG